MARPATAAVRLLTGEREPCRVATAGNITLSGLQTIDGVTVIAGDRVLVREQTDATENGIYTASAGEWYRAGDARSSRTINKGVTVHVQEGTVRAGRTYVFQTLNPDIGQDAIAIGFYISDALVADASAEIEAAGAAAVATITDLVADAEAAAEAAEGIAADVVANYQADWSDGYPGAQLITVLNYQREVAPRFDDDMPVSDTQDVLAAAIHNITRYAGKELTVPGRRYRFPTRDLSQLFLTAAHSGTKLLCNEGAFFDYTDLPVNDPAPKLFIRPEGTLGTEVSLTADVFKNQTEWPVANAAAMGLAKDKVVRVKSNKLFLSGGTVKEDELLTVKEVNTGTNRIYTFEGASADYLVSDAATIGPVSTVDDLTIEGLEMHGPGPFATIAGDRGIAPKYHRGMRLIDVTVKDMGAMNLFIRDGMDFEARGGWFFKHVVGPVGITDYNVCFIAALRNSLFTRMNIYGGSSGLIQSDTGNTGVTRDVTCLLNHIVGCYGNGLSMHYAAERLTYERNLIEYCLRSINGSCRHFESKYNHGRFHTGSGTTAGLYLTEFLEYVRSTGDIFEDALYAVLLGASDVQKAGSFGPLDVHIDGMLSKNTTRGISLTYDDNTNTKKGLNVTNYTARGLTNIGVEVVGTFTEGELDRIDLEAPSPVNIAAVTTSAATTNFTLGKIEYKGMNDPVFSGTGHRRIGEIAPAGGQTALPQVGSNASLTPSLLSDFWLVTGTTTILRIGNAAQYTGKVVGFMLQSALTVTHQANGAGAANSLTLKAGVTTAAVAGARYQFRSDGVSWHEV